MVPEEALCNFQGWQTSFVLCGCPWLSSVVEKGIDWLEAEPEGTPAKAGSYDPSISVQDADCSALVTAMAPFFILAAGSLHISSLLLVLQLRTNIVERLRCFDPSFL